MTDYERGRLAGYAEGVAAAAETARFLPDKLAIRALLPSATSTAPRCVSKDPRHFCGYAGACVYESPPSPASGETPCGDPGCNDGCEACRATPSPVAATGERCEACRAIGGTGLCPKHGGPGRSTTGGGR